MKAHPYAELFPMMPDAELKTLADDIAENGLVEPITLFKGEILDGRNRHRACELSKSEPDFVQFTGNDEMALAFVLSKNLNRRHLDTSQRAMVANRLATLEKGANQHAGIPAPSQAKAAELLNVNRDSVQTARKVSEAGTPELIAAVDAGEVTVSAAAEVAKLPKAEQKKIVKAGPKAVKDKAAEMRREAAKPVIAPEPAPVASEPANPSTDEPDGEEVGAGVLFTKSVNELCREMDRITATMEALKASPYAHSIRFDSASAQVKAARSTVWQGRPTKECPYCKANGEGIRPDCKACRGTGNVNQITYDSGMRAVGGVL